MRCYGRSCAPFALHSTEPHSNAFQKAVYVGLKFGATSRDLERDFGVKDAVERISRLQLAKWYGWTLSEIDDMSLADLSDAVDYMAAVNKIQAESAAKAAAAPKIKPRR